LLCVQSEAEAEYLEKEVQLPSGATSGEDANVQEMENGVKSGCCDEGDLVQMLRRLFRQSPSFVVSRMLEF
jgi:hypothetical protein